jgi:HK97 family phage major capsid protein
LEDLMATEVTKTPDYEVLKEELKKDIDKSQHAYIDAQFVELEKRLSSHREITPAAGMNKDSESIATFKSLAKGIPTDSKLMSAETIKSLSGFAKAVWMREHNQEMSVEVRKALGETQGSTGGFMVPYEFRPELLKLIIEDQVVRPRAQVVPMATDTLIYPRIVDTTHASSIHGGIKGSWTAEAGTLGTGDPAFGQMQLIAKKFTDYVTVSNELIMDSPISIAPLLGTLLREGLGFFEDHDMLWAFGAGQVRGVLKSNCLISGTRTKTSHIVYDDIRNMQTRLFPSSYKRAVWVCSPGALNDLLNMSMAVGTGGNGVFITNIPGRTAADEFPMSIFGRPLVVSEKMADLGTAGDIMVADFSYYIIGDRMDLTLTSSEHVAFATDQTAFRIIERLDGAPWIDSALTPNNGGSTLSSFVTLAA